MVSYTVRFEGREIIAQTLIVGVIITANQILLGALRSFPEFSSDSLSDRMMENQRFYHGWMHPVVFGSNKQTLATDFYESSVSESLLWSRDGSIAIDCQSRLTLTHLSKPNFKSSPFSMIAGYFRQVVLSHDGLDDYSVHLLDNFHELCVFEWLSRFLSGLLEILCQPRLMLTHFSKNNFKRSSFSMVARYFRGSTIIYDSIEFHFQVLMDDIRELHVLVWFSWSLCIRLAIICLTGLMGSRFSKQIFKSSSLTKLYSGLSNGCISFFDSFAEHIVQYVVDLQELIVFEGRLWSLYHLLTIVCLSGLMWSRFSKQILRVPHLQCSKIISEILCRHISNFKSLIVVVG